MGSRSTREALTIALLLPVAAVATAFTHSPRSTSRSCSPVLDWQVCTWVTMDGKDAVELGATVPMALIRGVPLDAEMVWPPRELADVPLPAEARTALGLDHLGVNWEAHGHPPATFMTPHFDFHFYNIPQRGVDAIDCSDTSKPSRLPAGYSLPDVDVPGMGVLVGLCVPRMGMHAMMRQETTATDPFEASLLVGYYGGAPVFFEPMVARARLLQGTDFTLEAPAVEGLPAGVHYPRRLEATYDAAHGEYRLVFTGFVAGEATDE